MSSATRWWSWPRGRYWQRAPWPSCAAAMRWWRPTLSADHGAGSADQAAGRAAPAGGTGPGPAGPAGDRGIPVAGLPLRADGVTAGYGGDPVIRGITVSADPGEVVSLVGPNGSGKSTLLKSLVGVIRVSAGTVTVGGRQVTNLPRRRWPGPRSATCPRSTTCSRR